MPTAIRTRRAEPADADRITQILRESITQLCVADHGNRTVPLALWLANKTVANISKWIDDPGATMLVAQIGPDLAAVGAITGSGVVTLNYVAPEFRKKGLSKAMVRALEREALRLGLTEIALDSTLTALRFYRSLGFADRGPPGEKHELPNFPLGKSLAGMGLG